MRLRYGNYTHRIAESAVVIERSPIANKFGHTIAVQETWRISGKLYNPGTGSAGCDAMIYDLEVAYTQNGKDLILEHANGRASHQKMLSRDLIGGTKIASPPQFGSSAQGEYIGYRSYSMAVTGLRPLFAGSSMFLEFTETIRISGGGARFGCREVNRGPGVRQQLRTHSTCLATQTGSSSLYVGIPNVPPPIWPYAIVDQYPDIEQGGPTGQGDGDYTTRTLNWSYSYSFPLRLRGTPHYLLG